MGPPAPRGLGGQARQSKYHHRTGQRLRSLALNSCIVQLSFLAFLLVLRVWCIVTNPKPPNRATSTQILRQIAPSAAELELIKRTIKRSGKPGRSSNHVYYAPELRLYTYPRAICWCVLEKKSQPFLTLWKNSKCSALMRRSWSKIPKSCLLFAGTYFFYYISIIKSCRLFVGW